MTQSAEEKFNNRNLILSYMKEREYVTVAELVNNLDVTYQLAIYHCTQLEKAGLVARESYRCRQIPTKWFLLNPDSVMVNLEGVTLKRTDLGNSWLNKAFGYRQDFSKMNGRRIYESKGSVVKRKHTVGIGSSFSLMDYA